MTRDEFRHTLIQFFKEHDPEVVRAVPKIVKAFSDREDEVFDYLRERYSVEIKVEKKVVDSDGGDDIGGPVPDPNQGAEPF